MGDQQIATGLAISFGTSAFAAKVTEIQQSDIAREARDTSHLGTTVARTFKPTKLYDPGELDMTIHFDPAVQPPLTGDEELITLTFPDGETISGNGFILGYSFGGVLEDIVAANVKIKWSGAITHAAAP